MTESRWYQVQGATFTDESGEYQAPAYSDEVEASNGFEISQSRRWIVRFWASKATLDNISSQNDTTELTDSVIENYYENKTGEKKSATELNSKKDGCWVNL